MPRSFRKVFPADGPEWEGEQGELTRTRCGKETSLGKHACLGVNPSSAESPSSPGLGFAAACMAPVHWERGYRKQQQIGWAAAGRTGSRRGFMGLGGSRCAQ